MPMNAIAFAAKTPSSSRRVPALKAAPAPEMLKRQEIFASNLAKMMQLKNLSQSDLASKVWGRAKDARGYAVARNRDRVSAYLAGSSMPEPANLKKIANELGCSIEELVGPEGMPTPSSRRRVAPHIEANIAMVADAPGMLQVQLNMLLPAAAALEILSIAEKHRQTADNSDSQEG